MATEDAILLTIFTEAALETSLVADIEKLGAQGYTITNARGKGSRGLREASWEANSNIRIEIICSGEIAKKITSHLQKTYYDNYAMVTFTTNVDVLRPEKFRS
ncbi:MAG: nitrogen regulatory protein PII [Candidatus Azotimanducaceae bacterium]|jgi:nitrogen regulatory protein PII